MSIEKNSQPANCLNCRFEPKWGKVRMDKYGREVRRGQCRWWFLAEQIVQIPIFSMVVGTVEHVLSETGCGYFCPTWETKGE